MTKISYRQTCILVLLCQIALKFLALPSLMYLESGSESIFVVFVLMVVDGLYALYLLKLAELSGQKNVYEFMSLCLGRVITKILLILLMLKYALVVANLSKGLEFFVVDNLYNELAWYYYVLPIMAVVGFMVYCGIRNIARVGEMVCWIIILGIIYITIKSFGSADAESFLPLFKDGVYPLFKSAYIHSSWFGSSTFLLMLFGKIDFSRKKQGKMIVYILISIFLVQFVYFVFYGLFQVTSPTHNFCLSDISQFSSLQSPIDELSWLIVALWIVAQAVQIAIYTYCLVQSVKYIFNLKGDVVPTLISMVYILLLSWIGHYTIGIERIFVTNSSAILAIVAQYIVPLIIGLGALINRKKFISPLKDKENNKNTQKNQQKLSKNKQKAQKNKKTKQNVVADVNNISLTESSNKTKGRQV